MRKPLKELLAEEENVAFIRENLQKDYTKLLLKYSDNEDKRSLIEQIAQKQRIRKKLPSYYQNPRLILPPSLNLAQASSEETAQVKRDWLKAAQSMADLSAGLGIDCSILAAMFNEVIYVEPNPDLLKIARHNFKVLGLDQVVFHQAKAEEFLKDMPKVDLIYLDPSRRDEGEQSLIEVENYQPNLLEVINLIKAKSQSLLVKLSPMISIPHYLKELSGVSEVWVISQRNECKEVCFYWNFNVPSSLKIRTINLHPKQDQYYENLVGSEAIVKTSPILHYLYLPNASILKAGLQDHVAKEFNLGKLAPNTHLYSSADLISDYPGRVFKVLQTLKPYHSHFRKGTYNIISRNFPEDGAFIANKLKIKKSHHKQHLIACQANEEYVFIEADLVL